MDGAWRKGVQHHAVPAVPPGRGAGAVESGGDGWVEVVRGGASVGELGGDVGGCLIGIAVEEGEVMPGSPLEDMD